MARLPREMGESLSLEVLKNHGDVARRDVVSGHGGEEQGLDWVSLLIFSNRNDSVISFQWKKKKKSNSIKKLVSEVF